MKVKLFRRVFCVVMCVVILACSSVNAFGAELFGDEYKYVWTERNSNYLYFYWINVNIPDPSPSYTGIFNSSALSAGMNVWISGTSSSVNGLGNFTVPNLVSVGASQISISSSMPSSGILWHMIPDLTYWKGIFSDLPSYKAVAAVTYMTTTLGYTVTEGTQGMHPDCGQNISSACVYYNPEHETNFNSNLNWTNTVAHEIGHALGFGHIPASTAIMYGNGNTQVTALSNVDKVNYLNKYCASN